LEAKSNLRNKHGRRHPRRECLKKRKKDPCSLLLEGSFHRLSFANAMQAIERTASGKVVAKFGRSQVLTPNHVLVLTSAFEGF
jgi:hypothetical protein